MAGPEADEPKEDDGLIQLQPPPDGGAPAPAPTAPAASPALSASMFLTTDVYKDNAAVSRKTVTFNAKWSGGAKEDYVFVQWVKGWAKYANGKFFQAKMYGNTVDVNFKDFQVDTPDTDPVYGSGGGVRWRYNETAPNTFSISDNPGPLHDSDGAGAEMKLDYKIAVFKSADVPATTTGKMTASPISDFQFWQYHAKAMGGGTFTHPA